MSSVVRSTRQRTAPVHRSRQSRLLPSGAASRTRPWAMMGAHSFHLPLSREKRGGGGGPRQPGRTLPRPGANAGGGGGGGSSRYEWAQSSPRDARSTATTPPALV